MELKAYCMKTKQKDVPFVGKPEMSKTSKGGFILKGQDAAGNKMSSIISKDTAAAALKAGLVVEVK
jgi:hypothetical protein